MKFLENFPNCVFQTFKDRESAEGYAKVFTEYDEKLFKELNAKGCGIYFTPNGFKGERKKEKLIRLNAVYADLDVAKEGDNTQNVLELKQGLLRAFSDKIVPNFVIDTKNGLQPLWLIDDAKINDETQALYVKVILGIIEWSKQFGSKGDQVKDVTRVLRLPEYNHMKSEPYLCTVSRLSNMKNSLEDLAEAFPYEEKIQPKIQIEHKEGATYSEIDRLDIKDLIIRAFRESGRSAEFDKQDRLVLDGRLTGTFQGKNGDRNYLASSSHEPFKGNRITAVADILGVTNKEAFKWILQEFNISPLEAKQKEKAKEEAKKVIEEKNDRLDELLNEVDKEVKVFTWGTDLLNKKITPIQSHHFIILAGYTGAGKTAFAFDVAWKNAKEGKKVLYLSLEMTRKEILVRGARAYAGIQKAEWRDRKSIPEYKKKIFRERITELDQEKNLILKGFHGGTIPTVEAIFELINQIDPDLTFVDNFDLIAKAENVNEYTEQTRIAKAIMNKCHDEERPVIVIHHKNTKSMNKGIGGNRGSGKIGDDANVSLSVSRTWEEDASEEDNAKFVVKHEKCRDFGGFDIAEVYFQHGTFVDEFKTREKRVDPQEIWQNKI